jgi:hypothetical protein
VVGLELFVGVQQTDRKYNVAPLHSVSLEVGWYKLGYYSQFSLNGVHHFMPKDNT